jgi:hypothetical protein
MGDVVRADFGRKTPVLRGFLPGNLGRDALEIAERQRRNDLIRFAKTGGPTLHHANPKPDDWWNGSDDIA